MQNIPNHHDVADDGDQDTGDDDQPRGQVAEASASAKSPPAELAIGSGVPTAHEYDTKMTHGPPAEGDNTYLLDYEAEYVPTQNALPNLSVTRINNIPSLGYEGLVVVIRKKVGRATTYRPRASYFDQVPELEPEEQAERSRRSQEANDRRAIRRASDFCIEHKCFAWVTLTFDDLHLDCDPVTEVRDYLATISRRHLAETDEYLEYRAVVADHDGRPHLHGLLSQNVDFEMLRDEWGNGVIDNFEIVARDDVEGRVRYMMNNVVEHRLTPHRFLCSKGGLEAPIVAPTTGIYQARSIITDVVYPNPVYVTSACLFGGNPRVTYRFDPIEDD